MNRCMMIAGLVVLPIGGVAQTVAYTGASVFDGTGDELIENTVIVVRDGRITAIGVSEPVPDGARVVDLSGRYVVPGFVDAHVHLGSFDAAERALRSGVTTARSMGTSFFADVGLRELARQGRIDAPEIVAAGYHVRPGLADQFFLDDPSLSDLMETGVHGEDAIRRVARALLDRGVDVIKTNATERAGLPHTDPRQQLFDEAELRVLVGVAEAAGVPVAAHAHGDEGGQAAVRAGVRSIEHGTYLSETTLALMAERGTYLVPTIAVVRDLTVPGGDYDNPILEIRGRHMLPRVREMAARARALGVKVAGATDTGYGPESVLRMSHEIMELVGIGMTPAEAIRAATAVSAELLGVNDHTGTLVAGHDADFLVLERNPLEEIGVIQDLLMVVSNGVVVLDREGR